MNERLNKRKNECDGKNEYTMFMPCICELSINAHNCFCTWHILNFAFDCFDSLSLSFPAPQSFSFLLMDEISFICYSFHSFGVPLFFSFISVLLFLALHYVT